ncbi:cupin domain-containing protein (plasmid) [Rhizobium gallicum]|uniref:Cupin domain-containing protein n=1 Tax=Rhizobium gallicum TaxID=56730 RepID=A0A1L5NSD0_9HYPH|nr:cupin domain-containing protein [Rhizobium gallicum]APO70797.1 cupin domain-containing protein [Rhizobium gallicum]
MHSYIDQAQHTELGDWGTPEDIGAETVSDPIQCFGRIDLGSPKGPVFGGLYAATRGIYRVVYPFHEHATVLQGEVELTDERTGATNLYRQGDSWLIKKGTPVRWAIKSDRVLKSYLATTTELEGDRN